MEYAPFAIFGSIPELWASGFALHVALRVAASVAAGVAVFLWWTWPCRLPHDLPGPRKYWYLPWGLNGVLEVLANFERIPDYCVDANALYGGKTWAVQMPKIGTIRGGLFFLTEPASVQHVLKDNFENYGKGAAMRDALSEFLGDGIFVADGPKWKFHRKVASHMFTARLLRESTKVALLHATRLCDVLRAKCNARAATGEGAPSARGAGVGSPAAAGAAKSAAKSAAAGNGWCVVDMQEYFFKLTMDVFTVIAFGVDLESVPRNGPPHAFAAAFDDVQAASNLRFFNPFYKVARRLQLTRGERTIAQGVKVLDAFAMQVIAARRRDLSALAPAATAAGAAGPDDCRLGPDLLSRFIEDAATKDAQETKEGIAAEARTGGSDRELRDIVLNFMIAGRDTTACALAWALFELASAPPACTQRLRDEWAAAMGPGGDDVTYEKLTTLSYAHAVVLEVLRLHPSVPKNLKVALRDDTLPDGTKIPAGCTVLWCPYAMNRDARYWPNPLAFDPGRFLVDGPAEGPPKVTEPAQSLYTVFHAGPRLCLGKPLALMELKLIIGLLLRDFDFELAVPHAGGYAATIVLPLQPGLMVKLTPRTAA